MKATKVQCQKCGNKSVAWLSKPIAEYKLKCSKCKSVKVVKVGV